MACSLRRVLNLAYTWLFDLVGGTDAWDKEYRAIFDPDAHEDFDYVDIPQAPKAPNKPARGSTTSTGEKPRTSIQWGGI